MMLMLFIVGFYRSTNVQKSLEAALKMLEKQKAPVVSKLDSTETKNIFVGVWRKRIYVGVYICGCVEKENGEREYVWAYGERGYVWVGGEREYVWVCGEREYVWACGEREYVWACGEREQILTSDYLDARDETDMFFFPGPDLFPIYFLFPDLFSAWQVMCFNFRFQIMGMTCWNRIRGYSPLSTTLKRP